MNEWKKREWPRVSSGLEKWAFFHRYLAYILIGIYTVFDAKLRALPPPTWEMRTQGGEEGHRNEHVLKTAFKSVGAPLCASLTFKALFPTRNPQWWWWSSYERVSGSSAVAASVHFNWNLKLHFYSWSWSKYILQHIIRKQISQGKWKSWLEKCVLTFKVTRSFSYVFEAVVSTAGVRQYRQLLS